MVRVRLPYLTWLGADACGTQIAGQTLGPPGNRPVRLPTESIIRASAVGLRGALPDNAHLRISSGLPVIAQLGRIYESPEPFGV